ncbi:unnamed protein product [Rotaria socialis]
MQWASSNKLSSDRNPHKEYSCLLSSYRQSVDQKNAVHKLSRINTSIYIRYTVVFNKLSKNIYNATY